MNGEEQCKQLDDPLYSLAREMLAEADIKFDTILSVLTEQTRPHIEPFIDGFKIDIDGYKQSICQGLSNIDTTPLSIYDCLNTMVIEFSGSHIFTKEYSQKYGKYCILLPSHAGGKRSKARRSKTRRSKARRSKARA
jgi:hypothetical protein